MKLLMIYCDLFSYHPTVKTLDMVEEATEGKAFEKVQAAFIHMEEGDEEREKELAKKLIKNLKWVTGKNKTKKIVLHSFAHLSETKADPAFTMAFFNAVQQRLENSGFDVSQTPFGYFLDLKVEAPGFSLARVFKSL